MKMTIKKRMLSLALIAVLVLALSQSVSAKFWGWENTGTTDWADGHCAYRTTCRVHYILWIAGNEQCETVTVVCSNQ
jgi:hypothetical protein